MQLLAGTSGFAYKEWKGAFYPKDIHNDAMLGYYASHFDACEINNSFYRMPAEKTLLQWASQVPADFRFVLKASQRITHFARLKDTSRDAVEYFVKTAQTLGDQLGPILFQLPPNMKADVPRLEAFLEYLPAGTRAAFEFRNASWFDDVVFDLLRAKRAALCVADTEEEQTPRVATVDDWGYLRLRRVEYGTTDLENWADWLRAQTWTRAYAFFKHEDAGTGPRLAKQFAEIMGRGPEKSPV